jgi:protein-S-isoprenylcysteine O-methyltransferase Ste14
MRTFGDYFQFICMTLFLLIFIGRTLQLRIVKGLMPFKLGLDKKGFNGFLEMFFFVFLFVWVIEVYKAACHAQYRWLPGFFQYTLVDIAFVKCIGMALVAIGLLIFIWALSSFKDSWRVGIDKQTGGSLVTEGIFRFSRNPIFLFLDLYTAGAFLINGTLEFLLFAILTISAMHYQILQEEKFLIGAYGQPYTEYCRNTARYFNLRGLEK